MKKVSVTKNIANYVKSIGVNLSELSRKSGVEYLALYSSLASKERERELRADELASICSVLRINPMDFAETEKEESE
ncbi:MAG: hypothetical protein ACI4DR_01530 [Roseburia sp.]